VRAPSSSSRTDVSDLAFLDGIGYPLVPSPRLTRDHVASSRKQLAAGSERPCRARRIDVIGNTQFPAGAAKPPSNTVRSRPIPNHGLSTASSLRRNLR